MVWHKEAKYDELSRRLAEVTFRQTDPESKISMITIRNKQILWPCEPPLFDNLIDVEVGATPPVLHRLNHMIESKDVQKREEQQKLLNTSPMRMYLKEMSLFSMFNFPPSSWVFDVIDKRYSGVTLFGLILIIEPSFEEIRSDINKILSINIPPINIPSDPRGPLMAARFPREYDRNGYSGVLCPGCLAKHNRVAMDVCRDPRHMHPLPYEFL